MKQIKRGLINNIKNVRGWRTNRKIVVIEIDDYGGIRMPSKEIYNKLVDGGFQLNGDRFITYDTLADQQDLSAFFDVLRSVRDQQSHPAVATPVVNVANPDFDNIRKSGFKEYHNEVFTRTLQRYYGQDNPFILWRQGLDEGIFVPEYHGREHISVQLWLNKLREGNKDLLKAFNHGVVAVNSPGTLAGISDFRAEFFFENIRQMEYLYQSLRSGVKMFRDVFGYVPALFVPGNGIFHPDFEVALYEQGIPYLNVNHVMQIPDGHGGIKRKYCGNNTKSRHGVTYHARNCVFEPNDKGYKGPGYTMNQIEAAFRWKKPAVISTHRVNFVGAIRESNRIHGLGELKGLLRAIVEKWPEVEFMSSAQMFETVDRRRFKRSVS